LIGTGIMLLASVAYHGAMGVYNGYYSSVGQFWSFTHMSRVILLSLPFNIILFYWYWTDFLDVISISVALIYSLIVLSHVLKKYFPISLQKDQLPLLTGSKFWGRVSREGRGGKGKSKGGVISQFKDIKRRED